MFFDNASTTKVDANIMSGLEQFNNEHFYNPGGLYSKGRESRDYLDNARARILKALGADGNIVFLGSATEGNNLALFGSVKKHFKKILVSQGEHPSIYNSALELIQRGYNVEFVNLAKNGQVDFEDFKNKMTKDVALVSIMHVSNETGAVNDIASLVEYAKEINPNVIFHSDGVQAVGKIDVCLDELGVDMYTMSAHKIYGFKGVGALYVSKKIALKPIVFGGGQENGLRSGTENLLGIYSLVEAVESATSKQKENYDYVLSLKEKFLKGIEASNLNYSVHSDNECSPYIVSISFMGCRAETILNKLSDKGIFIGNGSACSSKKSGNRILDNMGVPRSEIESNLRISFSKYNTAEEVSQLVVELVLAVKDYLLKVS